MSKPTVKVSEQRFADGIGKERRYPRLTLGASHLRHLGVTRGDRVAVEQADGALILRRDGEEPETLESVEQPEQLEELPELPELPEV